jgi:hypothetical protein
MAFEDGEETWALRKHLLAYTSPTPTPGSRTTESWGGQLLSFCCRQKCQLTKGRLAPDQTLTATTTWLCGARR